MHCKPENCMGRKGVYEYKFDQKENKKKVETGKILTTS